jgi:uncharacterized protein YjbI with pentapeptide repeats
MKPPRRAPREPSLPAELPDGPALDGLAAELTLEELELGDCDLSQAHAPGVAVRTARLRATRLAGATLDGLELSDVELVGCDLANLRARRAGWIRVRARTCRMTGLTLSDSVLRDVTIRDCRVDLASFAGCRLQRVVFEECSLAQTDFLEAELEAVNFTSCDLTGADLRGARLRCCELRDCRLEGLQGVDRLRGTAMPWADIVGGASLWAQALGIDVIDDGEPPGD